MDIARIPEWIEQLALRYSIPEDLQFAMDLCSEEALANIDSSTAIVKKTIIRCSVDFASLGAKAASVFVVEDECAEIQSIEG